MTAYVQLRGGKGYMKVANYDSFAYRDQSLYSGFRRLTGWIPLQEILSQEITVGATPVLIKSQLTPATGNATVPDEMAHTAPRALTWDETVLEFSLNGTVIAWFFWKDIKGWSNKAPEAAI